MSVSKSFVKSSKIKISLSLTEISDNLRKTAHDYFISVTGVQNQTNPIEKT